MGTASATELVGIRDAWGRVCATDCRAATDVLNVTYAQMDGIAVRSADFVDGIPDTSLWRPGRDFGWANTGTALPAGFDSVIPIEGVRFPKAPTLDEKDPGAPLLDAAPRTAGAFCRQRGCDFAFGDVVVRVGELACILGANGSGKTTTLRAILGLVAPTEGDALAEGASTLGLSDLARVRIFAYVPQASEPPFPYLVKDVVMLGRTPHLRGSQVPGTRDEKAARNAMARMGILGIAERPFTQLSGGQRQLVLIARPRSRAARAGDGRTHGKSRLWQPASRAHAGSGAGTRRHGGADGHTRPGPRACLCRQGCARGEWPGYGRGNTRQRSYRRGSQPGLPNTRPRGPRRRRRGLVRATRLRTGLTPPRPLGARPRFNPASSPRGTFPLSARSRSGTY